MESPPLFLGLDISTQSAKAVIYDPQCRQVIARGAAKYMVKESSVPGRAEQDPAIWIEGTTKAVQEAIASLSTPWTAANVRGVGVSGQQHGLVVLGKDGKVLRDAKLWCDVESAAEAKELSEALGTTLVRPCIRVVPHAGHALVLLHQQGDALISTHIVAMRGWVSDVGRGQPPKVPSFTATKILWLKRHEPEVYSRTAHVLLPHDYVNYWLTGRVAMECGDASGTGLLDPATRRWCPRAVAAVDGGRLQQLLPDLVGPDEVIGTVLPEIAALLGLACGVHVAPGSGDNAMSALGAGAVSEGQMVVSLGTSGTIFGMSPRPAIDPTGLVCPFCDATGAWLPLLCTLNCTRVPDEVAAMLGMDHATLTAAAEREAPGCEGVTFVPYLVGERTPNVPHATGSLHGLRPGLLRPGLLYRAALEGVTNSLLSGLRRMESLGLRPSDLRLVGGGSANRLWRQIIADAFQLPIWLPLEAESAALGAALQAAACCSGTPVAVYVRDHQPPLAPESIKPNPAHREAYHAGLQCHIRLSKVLHGA